MVYSDKLLSSIYKIICNFNININPELYEIKNMNPIIINNIFS